MRRTARRLAPAAVVLLLQLVAFPMPLGAWLSGLVFGLVGSLAAVGLVLVWRSNRILNFAQGDLGGFPATLAVLLVTAGGLPWLAGVALGLVAAVVVGLVGTVAVGLGLGAAPTTTHVALLTLHDVGRAVRESPTAVTPKVTEAPGATDAFHVSLLTRWVEPVA